MQRFPMWALAAAAATALVAAPPAHGQDNYLALKFGVNAPVSRDLKDVDADTGFNGEIALGRHLLPNFALELQSGFAQTRTEIGRIHFVPLLLAVKLSIFPGDFEPYLTAGAGAYFVHFEGGEDDVPFGYNAGLGFNYHTSPASDLRRRGFAGLEAKHFWAKPSVAGSDIKINGVQVTANFGLKF